MSIGQNWRRWGHGLLADGAWRDLPPTAGQRRAAAARQLDVPATLTRGDAAALLDPVLGQRPLRRQPAPAPKHGRAPVPPPLLTVPQVARRLGVTKECLYHWIKTGRLPATRHARGWGIHPDDVARVTGQRGII